MEVPHHYTELIVRVLSGVATADEHETLNRWTESSPANQKYFDDLRLIWDESSKSGPLDNSLLVSDWNTTRNKISEIRKDERKVQGNRPISYSIIRIAASLLILIGVAYLSYRFYPHNLELATQSQIRSVTLPDGSRVTVNANSRLVYPETFKDDTRIVSLEGEAFFEIQRDVNRPFLIETGNTLTKVLGTSFSVNASDDSVTVTVVTGKVSFYRNGNNAITLTPGEQGVYAKSRLTERMNKDENFLSWQTNTLKFHDAPLTVFSRDVSRHFKVPITISPELIKSCTITAQFNNQDLQQILDELTILFPVKVRHQGDSIWIDGKGCKPTN